MFFFNWYQFSELSLKALYEVLQLRSEVFIVEQNCVCLDPDGRDPYALHLIGREENALVAYLRLFPPTDIENYLIFGRICTDKSARAKGYGRKLMTELLTFCAANYPGVSIKCSAQYYLKKFYESFGFATYGDIYQEDAIPHIAMQKESV